MLKEDALERARQGVERAKNQLHSSTDDLVEVSFRPLSAISSH